MAGRDDVSAMREFVERYGLTTMTHLDGDAVWEALGVTYQPAWIVAPVADPGAAAVDYGPLGVEGIGAIVDSLS